MKKFTKPISVLLAAAMLIGLTGCSERDPNRSQSDSEGSGDAQGSSESVLFIASSSETSSVSSQQGESTEPVIIDVEMDDQLVSLPCKVKDIKNITIDHGMSFSVKERDNGKYMTTAQFGYNGTDVGTIYLDGDCSEISDLGDVTVIGMIAEDSRVPVSYKGLTFNSSRSDIIRALGDPAEEKDGYIYYYIEPEGSVTFSLNSEDKVSNIAIFLDIR